METIEFKNLLFDTAICVMACDGEIHENEISEMRQIIETSPYFKGIDVEARLAEDVTRLMKEGRNYVRVFLDRLRETELDMVQELLILEVSLRIIHADKKVAANERHFLNLIRDCLSVPDEIVAQRFGFDELLETRLKADFDKTGEGFDALATTNGSQLPNLTIAEAPPTPVEKPEVGEDKPKPQ